VAQTASSNRRHQPGNTGGPFTGDGLGGALLNERGDTATATGSTLSGNQASGGAGGSGANGGNGFGGSSLTVTDSTISHNCALGGEGEDGGSDGQGIGGGVYLAAGGSVCFDAFTQAHVKYNHASTSNDDVFGVFTSCP
jgi:hypothetical protein